MGSFAKKYGNTIGKIQAEKTLYDNSKAPSDREYDSVALWTKESWGKHVLEIKSVKLLNMGDVAYEKQDGTPVIADADKITVEFEVVSSDTLDEGTKMVWSDNGKFYPESFVKSCLAFVSAATKAPIRDVEPSDIDLIGGEDQPLTGSLVACRSEHFKNFRTGELAFTKSGEPRTRCTFNAHFGE
jgi:hypothetical protein